MHCRYRGGAVRTLGEGSLIPSSVVLGVVLCWACRARWSAQQDYLTAAVLFTHAQPDERQYVETAQIESPRHETPPLVIHGDQFVARRRAASCRQALRKSKRTRLRRSFSKRVPSRRPAMLRKLMRASRGACAESAIWRPSMYRANIKAFLVKDDFETAVALYRSPYQPTDALGAVYFLGRC